MSVTAWNPRDFTEDRHRTVDDRPYGGGPGMVMMIEPVRRAILQAKRELGSETRVIHLSPQGEVFSQKRARELSKLPALVLLATRYEGIDQRLIESEVDEEISLGDYVVSGGELPAMMVIDAVARNLPDVLGHEDSATADSFTDGLLDHPHYTRPESDGGWMVPEVLLGGNHEAIRIWRLKQALGRTWLKRPDLLEKRVLGREEGRLLAEFQREWSQNQG